MQLILVYIIIFLAVAYSVNSLRKAMFTKTVSKSACSSCQVQNKCSAPKMQVKRRITVNNNLINRRDKEIGILK